MNIKDELTQLLIDDEGAREAFAKEQSRLFPNGDGEIDPGEAREFINRFVRPAE